MLNRQSLLAIVVLVTIFTSVTSGIAQAQDGSSEEERIIKEQVGPTAVITPAAKKPTYGTQATEAEDRVKKPWYSWLPWVGDSDEVAPETPSVDEAPAAISKEVRKVETVKEVRKVTPAPVAAPATMAAGSFMVKSVVFTGDVAFLDSLTGLKEQLVNDLSSSPQTSSSVAEICQRYTKEELVDKRKYYLAYLEPQSGMQDGVVTIGVHTGYFGKTAFYDKSEGKRTNDSFEGRYFSAEQLDNKINLQEGTPFNYGILHSQVYGINTMPDLTLDGNLKVRKDANGERYVDTDFYVEEDLPLHGTFLIDNTGTEGTGDWRTALTVQHLNLTKRFDILSLDLSYALDNTLYSGAASYYLPFRAFDKDMSMTIFAGYSELEVPDITTNVDVESEAHFFGIQLRSDIVAVGPHDFSMSLELANRYTKNQLVALGKAFTTSDLTVAPLALGFHYNQTEVDTMGGRNFASYTFSFNQGGTLGSDGQDEFDQTRLGSDADYHIHRLQLARIQRLGGDSGKWLLHLKADIQQASEALIHSEMIALGGMDTIRGYQERAVLGDNGYVLNAELRTPLFDRRTLGISAGEEKPAESAQVVFFVDYGSVDRESVQPGEYDDVDLLSVGTGLRLSINEHVQFRLDIGFPLEDIEGETGISTDSYRLHTSLQLHY